MKKNISLVDFGAGNLHSVYKAFNFIGAKVNITRDPKAILKSDAVVFPGVGAFGSVMKAIRKYDLEEAIIKSANSEKPFLGICVGMQVLFEESEEDEEIKGLGIFKGLVTKFKIAKKIPHTGWNNVSYFSPERNGYGFDDEVFYFVHSYYVAPKDDSIVYATTTYDGEIFTSVIKKENLIAVQFHPEKSGDAGLQFLESFVSEIE